MDTGYLAGDYTNLGLKRLRKIERRVSNGSVLIFFPSLLFFACAYEYVPTYMYMSACIHKCVYAICVLVDICARVHAYVSLCVLMCILVHLYA